MIQPMSAAPRSDTLTAEEITDRLDAVGLRRTEPRRQLVEMILQQPGQFRAADLVDRAQALKIGRATVFRLLDQLVALGLLQRIHGPDGCHSFTVCAPEVHHHHLVCRSCDRVLPIETGSIEAQIRTLARQSGFQVEDHHLEVFGRCGDCQAAR